MRKILICRSSNTCVFILFVTLEVYLFKLIVNDDESNEVFFAGQKNDEYKI